MLKEGSTVALMSQVARTATTMRIPTSKRRRRRNAKVGLLLAATLAISSYSDEGRVSAFQTTTTTRTTIRSHLPRRPTRIPGHPSSGTSSLNNRHQIHQHRRKKQHQHDHHRSAFASSKNTQLSMMLPLFDPTIVQTAASHALHSTTELLSTSTAAFTDSLPFAELGRQLSQSLDIGSNLSRNVGQIPETTTSLVLESLGYDLLVFLAASVFVAPVCKSLQITPILGYLILGAILGPHGLDVFANSKADVELGDFGILFLLFSEGLDVSTQRLQKLTNFLPLGLAQIALCTGVISAAFAAGLPQTVGGYLPMAPSLLHIATPAQVLVLAFAGALSTSAFIFPVLKERGWEDEESGEAATSILLLQDLLVAPLLVLLPFLVGESTGTDYAAIGFLTAKATLGFGAVMYAASFVLRRLFVLVAQTQSTETFVALCLLVAAGMGSIAKFFGLTDTAGAFAAGVLLANTNYRAQIQADVLPFQGILLGIFFMDAGSTFDSELVLAQWPTIVVGAISLLLLKAVTLGAATRVPRWLEPNRLTLSDGVRVSLLLSGGGEFAFVVLALADKLSILPEDLSAILTAIILITMGVTPLLGQLAASLSEPLLGLEEERITTEIVTEAAKGYVPPLPIARDAVVVSGYGEIGRTVVQTLSDELDYLKKASSIAKRATQSPPASSEHNAVNGNNESASAPGQDSVSIVAFDTDPILLGSPRSHKMPNGTRTIYGNGASAEIIRSSGVIRPSAIFVTYEDHSRALAATNRLRPSFPDTPIYARAATRAEVQSLLTAGATQVVVEADELPRAAPSLLQGVWGGNLAGNYPKDEEQIRIAAAQAAGTSVAKVKELLELFAGMDLDNSGLVSVKELERVLERTTNWIASDDEIAELDTWIEAALTDSDPLDAIEFCRLYGRAPDFVKKAFGVSREMK